MKARNPRHMENLRTPTSDEAREMQRRGMETRRADNSAKHLLSLALGLTARVNKDGELDPDGTPLLKADGTPMTLKELGMVNLAKQYSAGNNDSIKLGSQLMGELKEQIEVQSLPEINCNIFGGDD